MRESKVRMLCVDASQHVGAVVEVTTKQKPRMGEGRLGRNCEWEKVRLGRCVQTLQHVEAVVHVTTKCLPRS
jgi:hypothetical protein